MDGGPRRGVINRSESTNRQPETSEPVATASVASAQPPVAHRYQPAVVQEPGFFKKYLGAIIIIVILLAVIVAGTLYMLRPQDTAIDSGKYQAVFFTNGQVYFGKLQTLNDGYMALTDVFYLQSDQSSDASDSQNPQDASAADKKNMQLVKLGKEIHGPEDKMVIAKDQLLFYENLKPDGKVAQSINKYSQNK